ncbi:hypothetical protein AARAC_001966 [Aspergillus arachidicola]|uniref:IucC family-domain-containing protein n=1 Tax=Aspergillus arachidicola TaxID=656916 RepID=A0A2G7FWG2_9EURO|nr:hypothetical protein AARAC_001966 [Aspergillus arachidicola]
MALTNSLQDAQFETSKRLLAQLVNEGLLHAYVCLPKVSHRYGLSLRSSCPEKATTEATTVIVHAKLDAYLEVEGDRVLPMLRPEYLELPILLEHENGDTRVETDPGEIFRSLYKIVAPECLGEASAKKIIHELSTTALNQLQWLQRQETQRQLVLSDPAVSWEQCLVYGHPTHPFHRLCYAQPPLHSSRLENLEQFLVPELTLISVPRSELQVNGPFEELMQPLLQKLNVPAVTKDRIIMPCFTKQLPSIQHFFPGANPIASIVDGADAQSSMRSVALRPHLETPYILKMSLGYRITSAVRTIASWIIPEVVFMSNLLEKLLPPELWIYREVAGVTGASGDPERTRQISCIIREDLEPRALDHDQALIIAAALYQHPPDSDKTYAEVLFDLNTWNKKMEWFKLYVGSLCDVILPPLAGYGIGIEAHAQNIVLRVCRQTSELKGFAIRDWGGVRLHKPTLDSRGIQLPAVNPESPVITSNIEHIWSKFHQVFLQNHIGTILIALGLETRGGWEIVREELSRVLAGNEYAAGPELLKYLLADSMEMRCFFTARLEGRPNVPLSRGVPNIVLR